MSKPKTRLNSPLVLILFFVLALSAHAADVVYTLTGTLALQSDPSTDPLHLDGKSFTLSVFLDSTNSPSSSSPSASSGTYNAAPGTKIHAEIVGLIGADCAASPLPTVAITDNASTAVDTIGVSNCQLPIYMMFARVNVPPGVMTTAAPSNIPSTSIAGQAQFVPASQIPAIFNFSNATLVATGAPPPVATPNPTSWTLPAVIQGSAEPITHSLSLSSAGAPVSYTAVAAAGGSWLAVSLTGPGNTLSPSLTITVDPTGLTGAPTTYKGTVNFRNSTNLLASVPVSLTVNPPTLAVPATPITFTYVIGGTTPARQTVAIGGTSAIAFTASGGTAAWLSATDGTVPGNMAVSVNTAGLAAGKYTGVVTVTSAGATGSPATIPVTLTVTQPVIAVSAGITFSYRLGTSVPPPQPIQITGTQGVRFTASVSPVAAWLSLSSATGTIPGFLSASLVPAGLAQGTYTTTVSIASPGATTKTVVINLTVIDKPALSASPNPLLFTAEFGGSNPPPLQVTIAADGSNINYTLTSDQPWLSLSSTSGTTSGSTIVTAVPGALTAGTYSGHIVVTADGVSNSPFQVPVTLTVAPPGTVISALPASLSVTAAPGSAPVTRTISIASTQTVGMAITVSSAGGSWLTVTPATATTPSTLTVTLTPGSLTENPYSGNITVTGTTGDPLTIPVTLNIKADTDPVIHGITDAAGFATDGFAPGNAISIFGANLGPEPYVTFALNGSGGVDPVLAGVNVTVDGVPAIVLLSWKQQLNAIMPFSAKTAGNADVVVEYNGRKSAAFPLPMVPSAVKLFTANAQGTGRAAALNQDFSVNKETHPAGKGEVVQLFGTGGGIVAPAVVEGGIAANTLSWVTLEYAATVNGVSARVYYAGTAPGLLFGVYQFNVQLPADVATGPATIVIKIGESQTQSDITVFVK
ncbi:MAG: hypothetical protein ABI693_31150 [Bryobacteraceae bacterium]